jgi:VWFA-related protein
MRIRPLTVCVYSILLVLTGVAVVRAVGSPQRSGTPQFRSGVTMVPVDVRVVDSKGKAITDLTRDDFAVIEDGVPQQIREFSLRTLDPAGSGGAPEKLRLRESALTLEPQTNRVFLIVLGRGQLLEPSKGMDAVLNFVRTQLLPQDQVAVFIYDRATDFTTSHEEIAKILEKFKRAHKDINFEIELQMTSGLAAIYGSKSIPKKLQDKIDMVFEGSSLVASHPMTPRVPGQAVADGRRQADAMRRSEDEAMNRSMADAAGVPHLSIYTDLDVIESKMFGDMSFEEYIQVNAQTLQDLGNCFAGIEYLRHIEGEKHLLYVTEKGMLLPRMEDDEALARAANDARVSIDVIQTGGIYEAQAGGAVNTRAWNQTFAFQALRNMSSWTGGITSIMDPAQMGIDRMNEATRNSYVLGYYPSNARFDGTYRRIEVKVKRPGATVLFRHGYSARLEMLPFDRRTFITQDRMLAAVTFRRTITDIKLKLDTSLQKSESGEGRDLVVKMKIDAGRLAFRPTADGSQLGLVDIAVFYFDQHGQMLGNTWQKAELKFDQPTFQQIKQNGIPYNTRIQVSPAVRDVRVVVYDFKADLVGSADGKVI